MLPAQNQARFYYLIVRGAQVAQQQIENENENKPISDEARLRALNALSYALHHTDAWPSARALLLAMSTKMEMAGHRQDWLRYLTEGLRQSQRLGDQPAAAAFSFHCGHLQRLMSHYAQAQTLLQASATIYASLGDQPGEAKALNQLAYLAWQQHKPDEAITIAQRAMALLDENDLERTMSLSALGLAAIEHHQWQAAEEYHRAALTIRTAHGNRRLQAWSLQNLASALRSQGNYADAAIHFEEAIRILTEVNDPVHRAVVQMNLGIVRQAQGDIVRALQLYVVAEKIFRQVADHLNLAKVLVNQGVSYLSLREWQNAESVCQESAELFQQQNNLSEYLNALDGVGISYLKRNRYAPALSIFEMIAQQLPQIKGTYFYESLTAIIDEQLQSAQMGVNQG